MARLSYIHGIKVTADKEVFANYARSPSYFKLGGNFAIYPGQCVPDFRPAPTLGRNRRANAEYWSRYAAPRLDAARRRRRRVQRAAPGMAAFWQVCRDGNAS